MRNPEWRDDTTLFEHAAVACPRSAKVQLQLGTLLMKSGARDPMRQTPGHS